MQTCPGLKAIPIRTKHHKKTHCYVIKVVKPWAKEGAVKIEYLRKL
jgi:hypothetical protein